MSKGVRSGTIIRMEKLSAVLLADQSSDTLPSTRNFWGLIGGASSEESKDSVQLKPARNASRTKVSDDLLDGHRMEM
jgi:hypothetical protein